MAQKTGHLFWPALRKTRKIKLRKPKSPRKYVVRAVGDERQKFRQPIGYELSYVVLVTGNPLSVPIVICSDSHVDVVAASKPITFFLMVKEISKQGGVSGEVVPSLFFPTVYVGRIHDRFATWRHGGDIRHERLEIVHAGLHGNVYSRNRHAVLFETLVHVVTNGKAETFLVYRHEFTGGSGKHGFHLGMHDVSDEADGI